MNNPTNFWDTLAPQHAALEDNFFDRHSARTLLPQLVPPVLVVGAGQGLIVEEFLRNRIPCDGVDLSPEMIRYANVRRGLALVHADARAMPFEDNSYGTVIYATGVIDFMADEKTIALILNEGRRVVRKPGRIFIGFYRTSPVLEQFLTAVGLLKDGILNHKASLEIYLLSPLQMLRWVTQRTNGSTWRSLTWFVRVALGTTLREKTNTFSMQKVFRNRENALKLIESAPNYQPYRNKAAIEALFARLNLTLKNLQKLPACFIAEI